MVASCSAIVVAWPTAAAAEAAESVVRVRLADAAGGLGSTHGRAARVS